MSKKLHLDTCCDNPLIDEKWLQMNVWMDPKKQLLFMMNVDDVNSIFRLSFTCIKKAMAFGISLFTIDS